MSDNTLPLERIRVVEFTHMVMGPATGVILADMGADVVKVEPLQGDNTRRLNGSGAGYFPMYNRNKRSICIDLKSDAGREAALRLVDRADVLIENFRPGAMEKLGFGYDELSKRNPRLIYCSLKGFLSGPYEQRTALDEVTQMMGGLAYMTGMPGKPLRAGSSVIDITGGMFGVIAILAALEQRHQSGKGQQVTSSLFETTAFIVGQHMAQQGVSGEEPPPMSVRRSAWSVYDIFECKGGGQVFVGVVSDTLWKAFCEEFGLDELAQDPALARNNDRVAHKDRILEVIRPMFQSISKGEAVSRLEKAGIPFAPINRPADLFDDPHLKAGGGLLEVTLTSGENRGQKVSLPALPLEMNHHKFGLRHELPEEGQNSIEVLHEAGYSDAEIRSLLAAGRVKDKP
ncbi:MAG TPA: CaiB/BaiF CoA-transferase family protein [Xanthomonadales bacterium]|nr:CaiB/BaiF CoA-transferase family protein [Xanthomonadales bacterium]